MASTTQWSISWTMALLPPQEMIPPESLFHTHSYDSTTSTNIEHLFGFAPCIPSFCIERNTVVSLNDDTADIQNSDSVYPGYEDFQRILAIEEHVLSL